MVPLMPLSPSMRSGCQMEQSPPLEGDHYDDLPYTSGEGCLQPLPMRNEDKECSRSVARRKIQVSFAVSSRPEEARR